MNVVKRKFVADKDKLFITSNGVIIYKDITGYIHTTDKWHEEILRT